MLIVGMFDVQKPRKLAKEKKEKEKYPKQNTTTTTTTKQTKSTTTTTTNKTHLRPEEVIVGDNGDADNPASRLPRLLSQQQ